MSNRGWIPFAPSHALRLWSAASAWNGLENFYRRSRSGEFARPLIARFYQNSKINASVDRNRSRSGSAGNSAEAGRVDVGVWVTPHRPVQYVDRIGADGE